MKRRNRIATLKAALSLPLLLVLAVPASSAENATGPSITEANVTRLTVGLLERSQFSHSSLDASLAGAFLERYLEVLDTAHSLFLRSDVEAFSAYRATLAQNTRGPGDTQVAHAIFARYLQRMEQRVDYVTQALQQAKFEFKDHARFALDRKQAPRPVDLAAANALWLQRLRLEYLQEKLDGKTPDEIVKTLQRRVERSLQRVKQMSRSAVLEVYLSALAHVYDPHSDYLGHEQLEEFSIAMNLSLFGIGARLQSEGTGCKIVEVLPGGPAARSGQLSPGDRIVAVAQGLADAVDVVDLPLARAVELIRGPKGTVVTLTVIPVDAGDDGVRTTISLTRDEIKLEAQRASSTIIDMPNGTAEPLRIGVINLPSFYSNIDARRGSADDESRTSATNDVKRLLRKFKAENVQGVVLDLRRNGGGSLDEAIKLTGLFIDEGPVVQTRDPNGAIEFGNDTDSSIAYDGPLLVLTSRFSASASEIVAGALQDYDRAVIVGAASTYGKGTVQSLVRLAPLMDRNGLAYDYDPGALKVTIRKFYRPSGASTQLKGVIPDIVLPSPGANSDVGEAALDNPLPWDTVAPAEHNKLQMVQPYLAALRAASTRRVNNEPSFDFLRAEIARLAKRLASKSVSLNEAERRQELADFEARKKAQEIAMQSHEGPLPVTYELTLRDAELPGLPTPKAAVRPAQADGAAINSASASPHQNRPVGDAQDSGDDKSKAAPLPDVILIEAQKIAADYLLLHAGRPI
ncbi:MAG: carboxyl-terminal processing protease [Gammaproteobacteria bacterium]|jgi:carboxyl-terminal processing protease